MPCSIAAWRTVLPFSTVICRPSIVSVTVSISLRSYPAPLVPDDFGQWRFVPADFGGSKHSGKRHAHLGDAIGKSDDDLSRRPIGEPERDRHRQVKDLSCLFEMEDHGGVINPVGEAKPRKG